LKAPNRKARRQTQRNANHFNIEIDFQPLNDKQEEMVKAYRSGYNLLAYGSAGTGKTFLALLLALEDLFAKNVNKIVIVRSAVPVRDQGFLPGSIEEKEAPMTAPYRKMVNDICGSGTAYDELAKKGMIEFISTSFIRGITLDNVALILDEVQNFNWEETTSALTRVGLETRVIVCGDGKQDDLHYKRGDTSGFQNLLKVTQRMKGDSFAHIAFDRNDIVRSGFVREFIIACEDEGL
jgi:phosphate starvation-inducible PhoH-like protein